LGIFPHRTPGDFCQGVGRLPTPSFLSQLFTADLSFPEARLNKTEFTVSVRQFLSLPLLRSHNGEVSQLGCGCEVEVCANPGCGVGGGLLDRDGNHALLCHRGVASRKATLLEVELEKAFRRAGGRPERQPATYRLLGGVFGESELKALFPGGLSQARAKRS